MKRKWFLSLAAIVATVGLASAQNTPSGNRLKNAPAQTQTAQASQTRCPNFVDVNNNGICDNYENGICQMGNGKGLRNGSGRGQGIGQRCGRGGCGYGCGRFANTRQGLHDGSGCVNFGRRAYFIDVNNNGICDCREVATAR